MSRLTLPDRVTCLVRGHEDTISQYLDIQQRIRGSIFESESEEEARVEIVKCIRCGSERAFAYSCYGTTRLSVPFAKMVLKKNGHGN
jgi:hypothetical protein